MEKLDFLPNGGLINSISYCLDGLSKRRSMPPGAAALLKVAVSCLNTIVEYYDLD